MQQVSRVCVLLIVMLAVVCGPTLATNATKCRMKFDMKSTAVFYKKGNGSGTISCENGQSAEVTITTHGGGITFGKNEIVGGKGVFSEVHDIGELFGAYGQAEASAGAQKSAGANAMWKGDVSLAISGTGKGVSIGFSFGKFKIEAK